jgi:hypothetical protein
MVCVAQTGGQFGHTLGGPHKKSSIVPNIDIADQRNLSLLCHLLTHMLQQGCLLMKDG